MTNAPLPPRAQRPREPILKAPPATIALALLLAAIYLVMQLLSPALRQELYVTFGFYPLRVTLALEGQADVLSAAWTLLSYGFLHSDTVHVIMNGAFLLAFGTPVERRYGAFAFLAFFLLCVLGGSLAVLLLAFSPEDHRVLVIGASAGVYGLMALAFTLAPRLSNQLSRVILIVVAVELVMNLALSNGFLGGRNVSWQGHAGGFVTGLALGWVLRVTGRRT